MSQEFCGRWEAKCLSIRLPLPTLVHAGYSVKLIKKIKLTSSPGDMILSLKCCVIIIFPVFKSLLNLPCVTETIILIVYIIFIQNRICKHCTYLEHVSKFDVAGLEPAPPGNLPSALTTNPYVLIDLRRNF